MEELEKHQISTWRGLSAHINVLYIFDETRSVVALLRDKLPLLGCLFAAVVIKIYVLYATTTF